MPLTRISSTNNLTLVDVIGRLSGHERVAGLMTIGSVNTGDLGPASDYDLLVVLSDTPTCPRNSVTHIDHRLTDLMFFAECEVEQVLSLEKPVEEEERIGHLIHWLQIGQIAFDRNGDIERAQEKVRGKQWRLPPGATRRCEVWYRINYNVVHNKMMLASDDPVYRQALDVRLLYGLAEVFFGYLHVRGILWDGEKAAIRHLAAHDPDFLARFNECVAETDQMCKVQLYERLAAEAIAPVGGLWAPASTVIRLEPGAEWSPEATEQALSFWEQLVAG